VVIPRPQARPDLGAHHPRWPNRSLHSGHRDTTRQPWIRSSNVATPAHHGGTSTNRACVGGSGGSSQIRRINPHVIIT
jgi:hypothetical protein